MKDNEISIPIKGKGSNSQITIPKEFSIFMWEDKYKIVIDAITEEGVACRLIHISDHSKHLIKRKYYAFSTIINLYKYAIPLNTNLIAC